MVTTPITTRPRPRRTITHHLVPRAMWADSTRREDDAPSPAPGDRSPYVDDQVLITAIILARLALPLLIPRFPLVILGALVLDAVDGTILEQFSDVDTGPGGP